VKYVNEVKGWNSRLDPVQAAILQVKLRHLNDWNARRAEIASRYTTALAGTGLVLPEVPAWAEPAWHLYVVQHAERDGLQKTLQEAGIGTLIHYPIPPHLQMAYRDAGYARGRFPIAESMANRLLSLPMGPQLQLKDVDVVIFNLLKDK
jgi:dTDP-4-amino-4,6-dideoxygalactose transaminase